MSIVKRLSASFAARVDALVSGIENHDAVIEAAIKDARRATAKARVRLQRLGQERRQMEVRLAELEIREQQWAERARQVADADEEKAMACLRRRRECQSQMKEIAGAIATQRVAEEKIASDVRAAEARINEMTQKRSLMRTRESAAEALANFARLDEVQAIDVDDTFERWEIRISEAEFRSGAPGLDDGLENLEREFFDSEERNSLRRELAELKKESGHE